MSAAAGAPKDDLPSEIRGLLVPLKVDFLLLPNAMVAEVVNYHALEPIEDAPAWLRGFVSWRGEIVPLVSVERLAGLAETALGHRARIVVCTTLTQGSQLIYFGLMAQGIPRLVRITSDSLEAVQVDKLDFGILARLTIGGEPAVILDVDGLERELLNNLPG
jgi:chemosensory pili system protein ChpC